MGTGGETDGVVDAPGAAGPINDALAPAAPSPSNACQTGGCAAGAAT